MAKNNEKYENEINFNIVWSGDFEFYCKFWTCDFQRMFIFSSSNLDIDVCLHTLSSLIMFSPFTLHNNVNHLLKLFCSHFLQHWYMMQWSVHVHTKYTALYKMFLKILRCYFGNVFSAPFCNACELMLCSESFHMKFDS